MSNSEEKLGLKVGQSIVLIVVAVLNVVWLVCDLIMFNGQLSLNIVLPILMFVASMIYALFAYKKPHGNFMRYLLLAYTLFGSIMFVSMSKNQEFYQSIIDVVMIILMAYMAGRLDHYKENIVICTIVLLKSIYVSANLIIAMNSFGMLNFVTFFGCIGSITCWLAIASSYIIRFKPHKQAGLEESK